MNEKRPPLDKLLKVLAQLGIELPKDTDYESLAERLYTAASAVVAVQKRSEGPPLVEDQGGAFLSTLRERIRKVDQFNERVADEQARNSGLPPRKRA